MSDPSSKPKPPSESATVSQGVDIPKPEGASNPSMPFPVIQIEGYRIIHEISRGGQAVVYCAQYLKTGRKVAVKVMREGPLATENGRARFTREAQILASLNHPNIVTILDRGQTLDGSEYFAMDYIDGRALDEGTWKHPQTPEGIDPDPARPLKLFLKICDAVNAAHLRGIVHRDLKPSNIRLDERGEPHVLDFGLARGALSEELADSHEPVTITGQFLGSLPWASPEQAEGVGQKIDMRSDVYSLGVILYQLVTGGTFPYQVVGSMRDVLNNIITAQPPAPSQILSQRETRDVARRIKRIGTNDKLINPALDSIILKALAKRRDDRYQSAGELARDIEAYLAGRPLQASSIAAAPVRGLPVMTIIAAAALILILIGIVVLTFKGSNQPVSNAPDLQNIKSAAPSLPAFLATSSLKQDYQDLDRIMNRFLPIVPYLRTNAPARIAAWRSTAEKGDPIGQFIFSRCYENGEGVERNSAEANRYLALAVEQKLPMALCMMGIRYRTSLPPIQNYPESIRWYTQAAEAGSARAMIDLGIMYSRGQGTPVDIPTALKWLQQAADLEAPAAFAMIGDIYRTPGNGVTDLTRALKMYQRAVDLGAPNGYLSMGQMHVSGNGVPRDYAQAMQLFRRADSENVYGAAECIADLYANGNGVDQDYAQAAKFYLRASNMNSITAMRKLAALHENGNGIPQNLEQATLLYTKAASAGDAESKKWIEGRLPTTNPNQN